MAAVVVTVSMATNEHAAAANLAGAAPYPRSDLVPGITWDLATYRWGGLSGDLWPVTSGGGGGVYSAWGDGTFPACGPVQVSYGLAVLGDGLTADTRVISCGPVGNHRGKIVSLLATAKTLYAT